MISISARRTVNVFSDISLGDVSNALAMVEAIQPFEDTFISQPESRPWNLSCAEHCVQVGTLARVIGEEIFPNHYLKLEVMGLLHDVGRFASHHPWVHGLAGCELLEAIGFGQELIGPAYSHLEAGAPLLGVTPENWPQILEAENLQAELDHLPLTAVIIAVADMAKKSVEEPAGSGRFVNRLCDPLEGVFVSGLRRLSRERAAALTDINPLKISGRQLRGLYKLDSKMGMYLGLCWLFRKKLVSCGVVFEGEDGVIDTAKRVLAKK